MNPVTPMTVGSSWRKLKATNFTSNYGTTKSTLTEPIGDGTIDCLNGAAAGCPVQNAVLLRFFGTDTNNQTGKARIWGISREVATGSWEYVLLAEVALTLGNLAGAAGCAITASDFEVDTITLTYGNDDVDVSINSPANDVRGAYVRVDIQGSQKLFIETDLNSSAASLNCLFKLL